ncbi:MAG: glycosyl hydrolase [Planctomycetota bacterium]
MSRHQLMSSLWVTLVVIIGLVLGVSRGAAQAIESADEPDSALNAQTFAGLKLRSIGPALMSGRISDLEVHPEDQSTWYVAVGSGGLWKTVNAGTTWTPIFDDQASYSIGCVTLDPNSPDVVWLGTGENVGGRHVGYGDGVYRSRDGGTSWENLGLNGTQHIGMIVVDPRDSNTVYVAAEGPLWSPGGERGLFKTIDGGASWEKILGGGEYTGVNELHLDPRNPDVMYAVTQQRFRNVAALINGGPESGIHKSTDGGTTWRELTNGLPEDDKGRIGFAVSPIDPDIVYATIELAHRKGGFYRSADGGESWTKGAEYISGGTGPHYYQELFACPHRLDRVYQMDVRTHITEDGGKTFRRMQEPHKHSDNHALAFDPNDPDYLLSGTDGGLYESWDLGETWKYAANLPVTQFYKVAVDYDEPFYHVIGGTQDNATQYGPSRTDNTHGIRNSDWRITVFGDGHQPAIDPTMPDVIYSQWQQGNLVRHDRKTGEIVYIQPQPADGEETDRFNWDAPILISPHNPATLFFASQRVWRSDDRGDSWRAISGDLSRDIDRLTQPMMGRVWSFDAIWDLYAMSKYGTVTSLAESPKQAGLIYAGTDDGLLHVTEDGGETWRQLAHPPGLPEFSFVNDIKADLHDADTVYVCLDNHKAGDFAPYVFKSTDRGQSWTSIAGDLPERHIVWRLVQDHVRPGLLFLGTEFGVYFTVDGGGRWVELEGGTPTIPFRDLAIQTRENDLVGATFGRGFYILDDYTPLRHVSAESLEQDMDLFPVRDALWYIPRRTLGSSGKAFQGEAFYIAPNPAFGATFTYYLRESLQTRKQARAEREQEIAKQGGDTPTPGWRALREEELEEEPAVVLIVRDRKGNVVRRLSGPTSKGIHRVSWSLTYPTTSPWSPDSGSGGEDPFDSSRPDDGMLVGPGVYTVHLATRVDGKLLDSGRSQRFEVVPLRDGGTLPGASVEEWAAFSAEFGELQRGVSGAGRLLEETADRLEAISQSLQRSIAEVDQLGAAVRAMQRRVADMQERLSGNPRRGMANDQGPVSISRRMSVVSLGTRFSLHGPTSTHLESLDIAERQFAELKQELNRLIQTELPALERGLERAGVPWTSGRPVPGA